MLEVKNVSFNYQDGTKVNKVLKDVNVSFEKGVFYSILGRSGSGKTTLLSLLSALDIPSGGNIEIEGKNILGEVQERLYRDSVSKL